MDLFIISHSAYGFDSESWRMEQWAGGRPRNTASAEVYMSYITGCAGLRGGLYAPYIAPRNLESGLCTPYRAPRKVAGRSHNPYERATRYSPFVFFGKK